MHYLKTLGIIKYKYITVVFFLCKHHSFEAPPCRIFTSVMFSEKEIFIKVITKEGNAKL